MDLLMPALIIGGTSLFTALTNPIPLKGEEGYNAKPSHHLRMMVENDVIFSEDCDYSHGSRIDYAQRMADGNYWGLSLTQSIYTPYTRTSGKVYKEHPYAGYLALGAAYIARGENFGISTELQLGTTGKASGAGEVQKLIHELGDMYSWDGWDDQIPSEFTMQLASRQDFNIKSMDCKSSSGWEMDSQFYTRQSLGTVRISAGMGWGIRYGHNLPNSSRTAGISEAEFGVSSLIKDGYDPSELSYYLLFNVYGEYVARDLFIDGGVFHNFDTTCSVVPWQGQIKLGIGMVRQGVDYYLGLNYGSLTYRSQKKHPAFGVFSIGWNW